MKTAEKLRETANTVIKAKEEEIFNAATKVAKEIIEKCEEAANKGQMHRIFNRNDFGVMGTGEIAKAVFGILESHGFEISGKICITISW